MNTIFKFHRLLWFLLLLFVLVLPDDSADVTVVSAAEKEDKKEETQPQYALTTANPTLLWETTPWSPAPWSQSIGECIGQCIKDGLENIAINNPRIRTDTSDIKAGMTEFGANLKAGMTEFGANLKQGMVLMGASIAAGHVVAAFITAYARRERKMET